MVLTELIEKLSSAMSYREQSELMLEYMTSIGIATHQETWGQKGWKLNLNNPTLDEYWESQINSAVCAKNQCLNVLTAVYEGKISVTLENQEDFVSDFIKLIDAIFPEGQNSNLTVYLNQDIDFNLKFESNTPSLYSILSFITKSALILPCT